MDTGDGQYVTLPDGHRIWVLRGGPALHEGSVPDVFLHGLGGSSLPFRATASACEAAGASTLLLDLRGHGFSELPAPGGLSLDDFADDVLRVLEALSIERANFIGHCLGGLIAMRIAALRPGLTDSLVLVATSHQFGRGLRGLQRRIAAHSFDHSVRTMAPRYHRARTVAQFDSSHFPSTADWYLPRLRQDWAHTSPATVSATVRAMCDADCAAAASELTARVCVVHGRHDAFIPASEGAELARVTHAERFEMLEDDAHASLVLRPDSPLPRIVVDFLHG